MQPGLDHLVVLGAGLLAGWLAGRRWRPPPAVMIIDPRQPDATLAEAVGHVRRHAPAALSAEGATAIVLDAAARGLIRAWRSDGAAMHRLSPRQLRRQLDTSSRRRALLADLRLLHAEVTRQWPPGADRVIEVSPDPKTGG